MRMGINKFSASEVIESLSEKDLELIFKIFGEEKESKKIAKKIIRERKIEKIDTQKLVQIINSSKKKRKKIHNATKIFQALRIFVNKEISELIKGLINSVKILKNGLIIFISFHSLEDKIIKTFFKSLSEKISRYIPDNSLEPNILKVLKKKPILPSLKEINENKRSRSAKLRYAIKINDSKDFENEIYQKFKYLIDVENLSEKL